VGETSSQKNKLGVVDHACHPSYAGGIDGRIIGPDKSETLSKK
jgi:hypothetical protein